MINDINPLRQSLMSTECGCEQMQFSASTHMHFIVNIDRFVRYKWKGDMKIRRQCIEYALQRLESFVLLLDYMLWLFLPASWVMFLFFFFSFLSLTKSQIINESFQFVQGFDSPFGPAQSIKYFRWNKTHTHTHWTTVFFISANTIPLARALYSFLQIVLLNFKLS